MSPNSLMLGYFVVAAGQLIFIMSTNHNVYTYTYTNAKKNMIRDSYQVMTAWTFPCSTVSTQMPGCPFGNFTDDDLQPDINKCVRVLYHASSPKSHCHHSFFLNSHTILSSGWWCNLQALWLVRLDATGILDRISSVLDFDRLLHSVLLHARSIVTGIPYKTPYHAVATIAGGKGFWMQ